jgi:hypothetical protein
MKRKADDISGQRSARCRKRPDWRMPCAAKTRMNRYLVALGNKNVNGLVRVRKRDSLFAKGPEGFITAHVEFVFNNRG